MRSYIVTHCNSFNRVKAGVTATPILDRKERMEHLIYNYTGLLMHMY